MDTLKIPIRISPLIEEILNSKNKEKFLGDIDSNTRRQLYQYAKDNPDKIKVKSGLIIKVNFVKKPRKKTGSKYNFFLLGFCAVTPAFLFSYIANYYLFLLQFN